MLRGSSAQGADLQRLQGMMVRFAVSSRSLMRSLFPIYESGLQQARTQMKHHALAV